jgi:hypothetical protein
VIVTIIIIIVVVIIISDGPIKTLVNHTSRLLTRSA